MNGTIRRIAVACFAMAATLGTGGIAGAQQHKDSKCADCGRVEQVRTVEKTSGMKYAAPIAGAVVGGVIGNQFGGGSGRTALTIAGALGGAFAGHKVEETHRDKAYEVIVAMDDGTKRSVHYEAQPPLRAGDRVKLRDGQLVLVE